jgi:hypothetical protein
MIILLAFVFNATITILSIAKTIAFTRILVAKLLILKLAFVFHATQAINGQELTA